MGRDLEHGGGEGGGGGPRRMGSLSYITSFYFSEAATQNSAKCAPGTVLINTRLKFVSFGILWLININTNVDCKLLVKL